MIAGGAVAAIGVAGLLTGVGLFAASNSAFQSFQGTTDEFDKLTFRDRAQGLGNGSVVAYILGTVALGTGAALIGVGARASTSGTRTRRPTSLPGTSPPTTSRRSRLLSCRLSAVGPCWFREAF